MGVGFHVFSQCASRARVRRTNKRSVSAQGATRARVRACSVKRRVEVSQVACGIRQGYSNIQSAIIYERWIHGVPRIPV